MNMSRILELLERRSDEMTPRGDLQPMSRAMARIADAIDRSDGNGSKVLRAIEIRIDKTTDATKRNGLKSALRMIAENGTTSGMKFTLPDGTKEMMPAWDLSSSEVKALERLITLL